MKFTFQCPSCKHVFWAGRGEPDGGVAPRRRVCGDAPAPDIMTAYANVGKTLSELHGCDEAGGRQDRLPREPKDN